MTPSQLNSYRAVTERQNMHGVSTGYTSKCSVCGQHKRRGEGCKVKPKFICPECVCSQQNQSSG